MEILLQEFRLDALVSYHGQLTNRNDLLSDYV